jgi:hypothetical protein
MRTAFIVPVIMLLAPLTLLADDKNPLPGKAQWDLRAFNTLFKVAETKYDADTSQLTWVLELKEETRTLDLIRDLDKDRVFQLVFTDEDQKELAIIQMRSSKFTGIPKGEKLTKRGTKLELIVEVPNVLEKTRQVTLSRVRGQ